MDFGCTVEELTGSPERIGMWDAQRLAQGRRHRHFSKLCEVIDMMGMMSKEAQGINAPLTSTARLRDCPTHRLYLFCDGTRCLGIIKVGVKKLFIRNKVGALTEIDPLCVLDFFVFTTEQRSGYGKTLYEHMLQAEHVAPEMLGIDRPSPKFLGFMKRHYNLGDYVPQTNNFVVFSQYFERQRQPAHQRGGGNGNGRGDGGLMNSSSGHADEVSNPYARNYGGGYVRGGGGGAHSGGGSMSSFGNNSASSHHHQRGGVLGGSASSTGASHLTLDQARTAITGPSVNMHYAPARGGGVGGPLASAPLPPPPHVTGALPPIRSGSIGSTASSGEGAATGPQPNAGQPPVPMGMHSSTTSSHGGGAGLGPVRGDRAAAIPSHGSFTNNNLLGSRRAQSPTVSAVNYNILNPSGGVQRGAPNSMNASGGGYTVTNMRSGGVVRGRY